jgi:hypothetical protein
MCGRAADRLMLLENDLMKMASAARVQKEPTCSHVWTQCGSPMLTGRQVMAWFSIGDRINDGGEKWGKTDVINGVYIVSFSGRVGNRVTEPFVLLYNRLSTTNCHNDLSEWSGVCISKGSELSHEHLKRGETAGFVNGR